MKKRGGRITKKNRKETSIITTSRSKKLGEQTTKAILNRAHPGECNLEEGGGEIKVWRRVGKEERGEELSFVLSESGE